MKARPTTTAEGNSQYRCVAQTHDFGLNDIRFDSSVGRGDFKTQIGVGAVIKGRHSALWEIPVARTGLIRVFRLGRGCTRHDFG